MKRLLCLALTVLLSACDHTIAPVLNVINDSGAVQSVETIVLDGLNTAVWRPSGTAPAPLVVFSHGFNGNKTQSTFLMEALAEAGYFVVAPDHADAGRGTVEVPFKDAESWTDDTYRERGYDIQRVIRALMLDPSYYINWNQVGLIGHSLGGYTVLGVSGAWPSWKLPNIKAVLALSPYCEPFTINGDLGNVAAVMYQGGTRDFGITPSVKKPGGCYDKTSSPAFFVEFQDAGHFAWTDARTEHHDLVIKYSVAFLDKYVRGRVTAPGVRRPGVSDIRSK